jgi:hypothetical protein
MKIEWEDGFIIKTDLLTGNIFRIVADKNGLISLAKQLLSLAQDDIPVGNHIHYDSWNSLEKGSMEFVIEKGPQNDNSKVE